MSEPPKLTVIDPDPVGPDVVERIREILAKAEAGEISCVAFAAIERDGTSFTTWSSTPKLMSILGAVHHLAWRMSNRREGGE